MLRHTLLKEVSMQWRQTENFTEAGNVFGLDITFTPALRIIPSTTAAIAKQAAWFSPALSFVLLIRLYLR
jgi:hypothetical protein